MITRMSIGLVVCTVLSAAAVCAQETQSEAVVDKDRIDQELELFRDGLFHAFNAGDYPAMLEKYCHPDIIATWQDGTTSEGHAGVLAEFKKLGEFISKMTVQATTDKRMILHNGRQVVSSGDMNDEYVLRRGPVVRLHSRWSATLVREGDRWLMISFSASTNAFDNEVVDLYLSSRTWLAIAAGVVGLAAGAIASLLIRRNPAVRQTQSAAV